jgi:hypothetical protein
VADLRKPAQLLPRFPRRNQKKILFHFLLDSLTRYTRVGCDRLRSPPILALLSPLGQPTEFGQVVRINEVENGMVSGYEVLEGNRADTNSFLPALEHHPACFGQVPQMATPDRGFFSAANERQAQELGVERLALSARGRL